MSKLSQHLNTLNLDKLTKDELRVVMSIKNASANSYFDVMDFHRSMCRNHDLTINELITSIKNANS